jgi:2-phosphosulfolactate phosphatase
MKISVYSTPHELNDDDLRGCTAVVIDVLRTSSTIITALANGAREVIPAGTPAEVGELVSRAGRAGSLMGGERDGRQIEGFDLGNSPPEYVRAEVAGKAIFFSSTNGTPALLRVKSASHAVVGSFNNLTAVLGYLLDGMQDTAILCCGRSGKFSLEDFICAGSMVVGLKNRLGNAIVKNDAAIAAADLYRRNMNLIGDVMRRSTHGKKLIEIGYERDLSYCAQIDSHDILPLYIEGKIRGFNADGSPLTEAATTTT